MATLVQDLELTEQDVAAYAQGVSEEAAPRDNDFARGLSRSAQRFENWLSFGIALYEALCAADGAWRGQVFRGETPALDEENALMRQVLAAWLRPAPTVLQRLEFFERHAKPIKGGHPFRLLCKEAAEKLGTWKPPVLSVSKALRTRTVTNREAMEMGFVSNSPEA